MKPFCIAAAILAATPVAALDRCLIGQWSADIDDLATLLSNSGMPGTATALGGSATLEVYDDGRMATDINDLALEVAVEGIPPTQMTMAGFNEGTIEADDGAFLIVIDSFSMVSEAIVLGERMTIPLDETTAPLGSALGDYTCSADEVLFEADSGDDGVVRMPRRWTRIADG
ncbi:hypothetical protein BC777_2030 [Yoonia maricola]|uniref:Uncharacterized protein n=1 Tax=Yoonia maricola TaxID=420999 RepID=A0A2M8WQF1_9RHOB|nr:hypothetical protein [Yoonia maricola]PJI93160.1 hypothetical protein BC777_2030 [Yoonia maricola]